MFFTYLDLIYKGNAKMEIGFGWPEKRQGNRIKFHETALRDSVTPFAVLDFAV
jgi:hypothetical protein